jgi:hypothetical protein
MWRAAGAIVRVSTPAGLSEQRKAARRAVFVGAPLAPAASLHLRFAQVSLRSRASAVFAYFLWQDKESKRPRGREAGRRTRKCKPARSASLRFNQLAQHAK